MSHIIEEESGRFIARSVHPNNGYYAGDFSTAPVATADSSAASWSGEPLILRTAW